MRNTDPKGDKTHFSFLIDREILGFLKGVTSYVQGRLLDVGCGDKPYYEIFKDYCKEYIGIDISPSRKSTVEVIARATRLPFKDETFETVLSTQVLEHIPEPEKMIREVYRVLKKGGIFILTLPQYWRLHEIPHDYFRFTRYGIEYLLKKVSFKILKIEPMGGAWSLIGQSILSHLASPYGSYGFFRPFRNLIKIFLNTVFSYLDRRFPDREDTMGYMLLARKE